MAVGTTAAIIGAAGMAANAYSTYQAGKDAKAASKQRLDTDALIPTDIRGLRGTLSDIFDDPDFLNGLDDPLSNAARGTFTDLLDPSFREGILSGGSALSLANEIGDAQRPFFQDQLNDQLLNVSSRFGPAGHRVSSDRNRMLNETARRGENQYTANVLGLTPQLMNTQLQGAGMFGSLANLAGGLGINQILAPLQLATQYATSFPGNPGWNPLLGTPGGLATGAGAAGDLLALLPSFFTGGDGTASGQLGTIPTYDPTLPGGGVL